MGKRSSNDDEDALHARKAQIYDSFVDFVTSKMRDRTNPNISVREFSKMPRAGVTHMELVLENVSKGTEKLYELTKRFDSRAFLSTKEHIETGNLIFVANVPYREMEISSGRKHHHGHGGGPPSTNVFMLYVFLFMVLVIVGVAKTSWAEWMFMLGR